MIIESSIKTFYFKGEKPFTVDYFYKNKLPIVDGSVGVNNYAQR